MIAKVDYLQTNLTAEELKTAKEDLNKALKENDGELSRQRRDADQNCRDLEEKMNSLKREQEANVCTIGLWASCVSQRKWNPC